MNGHANWYILSGKQLQYVTRKFKKFISSEQNAISEYLFLEIIQRCKDLCIFIIGFL